MRIDQPSGNLADLSGSFEGFFRGIFSGSVENLSESFAEVYRTIDRESGSIHDDIYRLSGSFDQDRTRLSQSFAETIANISGSIEGDVAQLSASISGTIDRLSGSFDYDRSVLSASFAQDRFLLSRSFDETITYNSQSVYRTVQDLSQSFDHDRTELSRSFDQTIKDVNQDLQDQIDETRATYTTTESFKQYQGFVDETYYKSGSQATLDRLLVNQDATFGEDVLIMGNLKVEGSSSVIHTEEITVADHFVEIASGAVSASEADGAGFGIQGADVTMSYHYTLDGGYMELNRPLVSPSFTGSLQGDVKGNLEGNVTGNLEGTASNAVSSSYAVTASYAHSASEAVTSSYAWTASYASEIWDDGVIALAIKRLENVARTKTEDGDRGLSSEVFYLNCGAHKDYQTCSVDESLVMLDLPDRVVPGVEHYLLISNIGAQDCIVTGSEAVMIPPSILDRYAWEYRYEYKYLEYSVPDVQITATQTIPSQSKTVFDGHIDGGDSGAVTGSRSIVIDQINISASAVVPTPLTGSFVSGSGSGSGSGSFENKFMVPQGQRLCLSYFTVDNDTVVITSAQRLRG